MDTQIPKPTKPTEKERLKIKLDKLKARQAKKLAELKAKKDKQVKKAKQPKLSELKKSVQKLVNKYVLLRDKDLPCISCGATTGTFQAGHYIAQGSSGLLRYHLLNINKQCAGCNLYKHGNLIEYRVNLVERIGQSNVEGLEEIRHLVKKWTREELEEIRGDMNKKISELVKEV